MKTRARSWLHLLSLAAGAALLLALTTGCGAISAAANPKVAWALNDPAPMRVVVRRADAAEKTAKEVDRVLTATPVNPDSDWPSKIGPAPGDAAAQMKALTQDPAYAGTQVRIVPSEVWVRALGGVQSTEGQYSNLLAFLDKDLGGKYQKIIDKTQEIAGLRAQVAADQAAADDKTLSDADRKTLKDKAAELDKQAEASDKEIAPMQKDFVAAAKAAAGNAPADLKDKLGPAFVNLRQAVEDAQIANGAAAVRYPLAAPTVLDGAKAMVPVFVADILEEKTGKRPTTMSTLQPDVKLDGTKVALTLNGLSDDDLGKVSVGELTTETLDRTQKWVGHALGLLGAIASTKEVLSFQDDVLGALLDGFGSGGWKAAAAAKIPAQDSPEVASATPAPPVPRVLPKTDTTAVTSADVKVPGKGAKTGAKATKSSKAGKSTKPAPKPASDPGATTAPAAKVVKPSSGEVFAP